MNESLIARADDADVLALAEKTGRSPEGIAARANALDRGELDREAETGRGRPFARALLLGAPEGVAAALLANVDDDQAADGAPEFSPGDWLALRAAVLAEPGVNRELGGGSAWIEWGNSEGGAAPMYRLREFSLVIGTDDAGENVATLYSGDERYIAAELADAPAAVPA
jgi:hypothetical protein